jgi:hypothetical protein
MNVALALENKISRARRALFVWRFRHQERLSRFALGMAYAFGRPLAEGDLHTVRVEMQMRLGYYPLMTLGTEDVLQNALDIYGEEEAEKLKPYLDAACDRVAGKWSNDGESFGVAVDWALENALAYAADDGITLTIRSDALHFNKED